MSMLVQYLSAHWKPTYFAFKSALMRSRKLPEGNAAPSSDSAPSFDAHKTGDLRHPRQASNASSDQARSIFDETRKILACSSPHQ